MADKTPPTSSPSPATVRLSLFRRIGRRGVRVLRPLALPLLHRLQMRFQSAIDHSSISARLSTIEATLNALVSNQASNAADARDIVNRLQIGIDAIRLDQHELVRKVDRDAERASATLAVVSAAQEENVASFARLIQRSSLSLGEDVLLNTPDGFLLVPAEDRTLLAAVWESGGRLEPGTVKVLTALLREGDQVIDVGAHIGLTVLPAARKVGPRGRVVAFEPGSRVASLLEQSLALNFVSERVIVHRCAAGDKAGKARLHLSPILGESSLLDLPVSRDGEDVDVQTVDSLVEPGRPVRLVKIDAEGYEPQVWRGMQRVIADNPELVVLVEFGPAHLRRAGISIDDWLAGFVAPGFKPYEVDELTGVVRPIRPVAALGTVVSLNLLILRQPPTMFPELQFE